jgi:hypothetical protein
MGLLRRRPQTVLEPAPVLAAAAPAAPAPPERCRVCTGQIVIDADHPSELVVAMLNEDPNEASYALAHRACAEKARGRLLPF